MGLRSIPWKTGLPVVFTVTDKSFSINKTVWEIRVAYKDSKMWKYCYMLESFIVSICLFGVPKLFQ